VVPNIQITRALGVKHDWDEQQLCWRPQLSEWGECDVAGVHVAGDGGGIGGAKAAEISGRISALNVLESLGYIDTHRRDQEAAPWRRQRNREAAVRPFLDALYRPADQWRQPADDTVVCRCEEVSAGTIRQLAAQGCLGPNQMKSFTRCGMGPCQGRMCGLTVSEILAAEHDRPVEEIGYYRLRPPFKALTLTQLASAAIDADERSSSEVFEKAAERETESS
jgi:bacterioferritin-associated ferredoxin